MIGSSYLHPSDRTLLFRAHLTAKTFQEDHANSRRDEYGKGQAQPAAELDCVCTFSR